jgi:phosphatidylinositol glycan class T
MPGAEVWLYFGRDHSNPKKGWTDVTNLLSGQFCSSLNFIDNAASIQPAWSFKPEGVVDEEWNKTSVFYASLPQEAVCTENLTPWKKLLPCFAKTGIGSLLSASHIFNTDFISIAIDVKPICRESLRCTNPELELIQSVSIVLNLPAQYDGKQSWSLYKMFGRSLISSCPLASSSNIYVDVTKNTSSNPHELTPTPSTVIDQNGARLAVYNLKEMFEGRDKEQQKATEKSGVNIADQYTKDVVYTNNFVRPDISISRSVSGYGVYTGGIVSRIQNNRKAPVKVLLLDVIPWYLRIYVHTLKITNNGREMGYEKMFYDPAVDRSAPHHLELVLTLPSSSTTQVEFSFERSFLKWTEYPPDANHGVYAGSAILTIPKEGIDIPSIPYSTSTVNVIRIHSQCLLISLPTPDFSMPYNVICLVSTVISLAFGPLHNLTTRTTRLERERGQQKSLFSRITELISKYFKRKSESIVQSG